MPHLSLLGRFPIFLNIIEIFIMIYIVLYYVRCEREKSTVVNIGYRDHQLRFKAHRDKGGYDTYVTFSTTPGSLINAVSW